jgi:hypothetical protein
MPMLRLAIELSNLKKFFLWLLTAAIYSNPKKIKKAGIANAA